ncbi:MAG: DNRLRE domain-containing protein [Planctomycetaceae bacterium]
MLAGNISNGAGQYIVTGGATGSAAARRGLVSFDIASAGIPVGSTILDVVLSMNLAETIGGSASVSVHKLMKAWSEAGSDASGNEFDGAAAEQFDATWLFSMFDSASWSNAGGDFSGSSASVSVDSLGIYEWIGGGLIGDVQEWLDDPGVNHGWLIHGSEVAGNVKGFDSRDSANAVLRPTLEITYEEPVLPSIVEGRKFFDRNADGIHLSNAVANLQLQYNQGKSYYNSFGGQEYWYRSQTDNSWYFVRPSGNLVKWDGQPRSLTGQTFESLDPRVWYTPSTLISNGTSSAEPWLNGFTFELLNSVGTIVATTSSRDIDRNGDSIIHEETESGWYRFENVGSGTFTIREVPVSGWAQSVSATSPLARTAYSLDSSLGLKFTGTYHENYGGRGERWLSAGSQWYYVTPTGDLYQWNGAATSTSVLVQGTMVASLGMSYYNDPALIWAAVNPVLNVTAGSVVQGGDFGNYQPAVISGRKWHDFNPDGVRNTSVYDPSLPILLDPTSTTLPGSGDGPRYLVWVQDAVTGSLTQVTYILNPTTRLTRFTTSSSASSGTTLTDSIPGIVGSDPEAVAAYLFANEPWLNGWTFELLNERGYVVATSVSADRDLSQNLTIEPEQERGWYLFDGLLPGKYTIREVQQAGWIQVSPPPVNLQPALASLQTQYGFKPTTNDSYNFGGLHERWFQSRTNAWFYLTPSGALYEWNKSSGGSSGAARGTKIAQLSGSVYLNPKLLYSPSNSTVTVVSGSIVNDRYFGNHNLLDGVFSSLAGQLL